MQIHSINNFTYSFKKPIKISNISFASNNGSSVDLLLKQREKVISTMAQAQAELNRAYTYNSTRAEKETENRIADEKNRSGVNRFKNVLRMRKTIEDKHWERFYKEQEEIRYIKENKDFFTNIVSQSQALLEYLDKEIEKIIGVSIDMVLGQIQPNRKTTVSSYIPCQVPTVKNKNTSINSSAIPLISPKAELPTLDEFQKLEKEDMSALVSRFSKGTKEEKQLLLDFFTTLNKKYARLPEKSSEKLSLGRKLYVLEKQMIESNISFVPKAPSSFATEADKIVYIQSALNRADINEASVMDALTVFEKYGNRYEYERGERIKYTDNGMNDLYVAITHAMDKFDGQTADEIMSRYLDIFNKYAKIDGKNRDTRFLERFITHNTDKMSEATVNKLIDTLKQFSFERKQAWLIRAYLLKSEFTKRSPEELARIDVKLKELEEIVKDMPKVSQVKPKGMSGG